MNVIIRADSSVQIGTGHIMRCITLAAELKLKGINAVFITRKFEGSVSYENVYPFYFLPDINENKESGSSPPDQIEWYKQYWEVDVEQVILLMRKERLKADMVIVDHYGLDFKWEKAIRQRVPKVMVIDDLANRAHYCELLLDQNYVLDMNSRYSSLLPETSIQLLGPTYTLLRSEFASARTRLKPRNGKVKRILISFGGSDPTGETYKTLQALDKLNLIDTEIHVVVGKSNPFYLQIKNHCNNYSSYLFYQQVNNMAELMLNSDLAIGAGGTTTWERCFLGLPCLTIVTAKNQLEITKALDAYGATKYIGESSDLETEDIREHIIWALQNPDQLRLLSEKGIEIMGERSKSWKGLNIVSRLIKEKTGGD